VETNAETNAASRLVESGHGAPLHAGTAVRADQAVHSATDIDEATSIGVVKFCPRRREAAMGQPRLSGLGVGQVVATSLKVERIQE
jgi:hypothetical protein